MKVCVLGAGNVAGHLIEAFGAVGCHISVWNHAEESLRLLRRNGCNFFYTTDMKKLPIDADIYIISVKDNAVCEVAKDLSTTCQIHSVDYNSTLKVMSVVIDSGSCILFHIAYTNRINFTGGFVVNAEHCVCACMGSFSHLLAIAHQSGEISIHRLSWVNDSLMPRPEYHFNIHRYDDLYPPPIDNYHTQITCLAWNWENDHLAVGYADRCLAVWNLQENPIFWYSWKHHDSSIQIQSCCFSAMGDCILFNGGYVENTTISNTLLTQQFLITKPTQICK